MDSHGASPILLIDDDETVRATLQDLLAESGFEVATAADGIQALRYLRTHPPPSLIILDLMMPFMDGFEFRRTILEDPALEKVPVVITTALTRQFQEQNSLRAAAYLHKPLEFGRLLEVVRTHCG
jgi:CheY-like chemotaxis protein